jgi:carbonic anhydrase
MRRGSPYKSVVQDIQFLKTFPSLNQEIDIVGMVLDIDTGLLEVVSG